MKGQKEERKNSHFETRKKKKLMKDLNSQCALERGAHKSQTNKRF